MKIIERPESMFLKLTCSKCKNEQTIFDKPATNIKCLVCGSELAKSTGGKAIIKTKIIESFG